MTRSEIHTPEDVVTCLRREFPDADLSPYSELTNLQIKTLICHLSDGASLTHLGASVSTRALIESLGDGLSQLSHPPGDDARLPPESMDTVDVPP
eukprot:7336898-Pyramimonas_sp.AAC.1